MNSNINLPQNVGVFAIINMVTSKVYVGASANLSQLKKKYFYKLRNRSKYTNRELLHDFHKYGEDSFLFSVLEYVDDATLLTTVKQQWHDMLSSKSNLYNVRTDVTTNKGTERTQEFKDKMSKLQVENGYTVTVAQLDAVTGKTLNVYDSLTKAARAIDVTPSKMHEAIANSTELQGYRWHRLTSDKREHKNPRKVELHVLGTLHRTYDSVAAAAKDNNYTVSTMYQKIRRDRVKKNPTWKYVE